MQDVKRILMVVRATKDCREVIDYAFMMARRMGAMLYVLDVIHNPFAYEGWNLPMPALDEEYKRLLKETREQLRLMVEEQRRKGLAVESLIREGDPASIILKEVEEKQIDLLMLPAHEENRIEHFLYGKANEKVIRKMACSILLVKEGPLGSCG